MNAKIVLRLISEAYDRFLNGDRPGYDAHMAQARAQIGDSPEEAPLLGEWTLTAALPHIRDIKTLIRMLDEAISYMQGRRSSIVTPARAGGFSNDSVLWLMLQQPGTADAQEELFRPAMARFDTLTGCGLGYPEFFQAELAYQRGDLTRAHVLAYQAVYLAQSTRQKRLTISAAKLIGYIAIHFQDMRDWSFAVKTMTDVVCVEGKQPPPTDPLLRTMNVVRSELLILLQDFDSLPAWVMDGRFEVSMGEGVLGFKCCVDDPRIGFFDFSLALLVHALYLLYTGQFARVLAADVMQRMFGMEDALLCYRIHYALLRGVSYLKLHDRDRAKEEFSTAVRLAVPDGLWLTLGMFSQASEGLILEAVRENGGDVAAVRRIGRGLVDNAQALLEAVALRDIDRLLSAREREVALLAAEGMRNREIAEKLSITEQTVKFHLSNTYSKLEINNRSKLTAILKNPTENYTKG